MIAIDEVDVRVAGRSEEHGGSRCVARGGVRSGVIGSEVSLDFHNAGSDLGSLGLANQDFAKKVAGDAARVACEEAAREWLDGFGFKTGRSHAEAILNLEILALERRDAHGNAALGRMDF